MPDTLDKVIIGIGFVILFALILGLAYVGSQPRCWFGSVQAESPSLSPLGLQCGCISVSPTNTKIVMYFDPNAESDNGFSTNQEQYVTVPLSCNVTVGQIIEVAGQHSLLGFGTEVPDHIVGLQGC